jgi:hypothetical protein
MAGEFSDARGKSQRALAEAANAKDQVTRIKFQESSAQRKTTWHLVPDP